MEPLPADDPKGPDEIKDILREAAPTLRKTPSARRPGPVAGRGPTSRGKPTSGASSSHAVPGEDRLDIRGKKAESKSTRPGRSLPPLPGEDWIDDRAGKAPTRPPLVLPLPLAKPGATPADKRANKISGQLALVPPSSSGIPDPPPAEKSANDIPGLPALVLPSTPRPDGVQQWDQIKNQLGEKPREVVVAVLPPAPSFRLSLLQIVALVGGIAVSSLWVWFISSQLQPPTQPLDPAYAEASARWAVVLTSQRIDEFRREYHHLPAQLSEFGWPGTELISYERVAPDRYRLVVPSPSGPLIFDSIGSRADYLGRSVETLQQSAGGTP